MRGKQLDKQTIYNIMASYAITQNYSDTAKQLSIPLTTVRKIVLENKNKNEYVELCNEKKNEFADKATTLINKGLELLDRRLSTAIKHEDELESLISEIYSADKEELSQDEKKGFISKIRALQIQKMGDITTAIGTLYDKRALAQGDSTENVTFTIPNEVKKYAE